MATDTSKNKPAATSSAPVKSKGQLAFEAMKAKGAQEVYTDRPIIKPEELGDDHMPIQGWFVCTEELNLPKGAAKRADGKETWTAGVIHLTAPTTYLTKDGDIETLEIGREVFIAINNKNDFLLNHLGKIEMVEVIVFGNGTINLGSGRNPMQDWRVIVTEKTLKRTGNFLIGGPGTPALGAASGSSLAADLAAIEGQTVAANGQKAPVAAP